jgi:hypothetical protein
VAFAGATHRLEPVDRAMRQHNQITAFAIWPRLASLPLGNVAAIAAEASAVIEIGTMRLIWSCHTQKEKTPRR